VTVVAVFDCAGFKDTTRAPRAGETDGVEYHFTTPEGFQELVKENAFIEHATFAGRSYGTSFAAVKDVTSKGRACILDIEMEVCVCDYAVHQQRRQQQLILL
jgi:guanylate kinase